MKENKHLLAPEHPVNPVKNLFIISGRRLAACGAVPKRQMKRGTKYYCVLTNDFS
ncbi:MAG TPA: hypothetical protein VM658_17415 [bacterium]|nr:hypothetical protein [bacterium]